MTQKMTKGLRQKIADEVACLVFGCGGQEEKTIADVAKKCGVSAQTITKIIRGVLPSPLTAMRIERRLKEGK